MTIRAQRMLGGATYVWVAVVICAVTDWTLANTGYHDPLFTVGVAPASGVRGYSERGVVMRRGWLFSRAGDARLQRQRYHVMALGAGLVCWLGLLELIL